jgi:hypothetical protein
LANWASDGGDQEFQQLKAAYDRWWQDVQPDLVNEDVAIPKYNAFHELYWKQFGGGPKDFKQPQSE